jgi:hypothetical protein
MAKDKDIKLAQANVSIQNLIDYLVDYAVTDSIQENYCPWASHHDLDFAIDEKTEPKNCQRIDCEYCKQNLYPPVLREGLLKKYIIHQ